MKVNALEMKVQAPQPKKPRPIARAMGRGHFFGPEGRELFGMFHEPAAEQRDCAVVLCPPITIELQCTYRAQRHLAQTLAQAGFPVLRFDYRGTGDSPGPAAGPGLVASWLESIRSAIEEAKRRAGTRHVVLCGTRMGGTLAAQAVSEGAHVDALVLVAPCVTGHAFLRELRAMHAVYKGDAPPTASAQEGAEEILGTLFDADLARDLRALDLTKLVPPAGTEVLLMPRDDLPQRELALADKWQAAGHPVVVKTPVGFASMVKMLDPSHAQVPEEMWAETVSFLSARFPPLKGQATAAAPFRDSVRVADAAGVRESVVRFGGEAQLFGILVEPEQPSATRPVLVLPNTGANHRIGTHRHWVGLARELAVQGFTTFRFDLSGLGDSPVRAGRKEAELYTAPAIDDTVLALDWLEARGHRYFVVAGLCAGAYVAFFTALRDARVQSLIMMNPLVFDFHDGLVIDVPVRGAARAAEEQLTGEAHAVKHFKRPEEYRRALLQAETWKRVARGQVNVLGIANAMAVRGRAKLTRGVSSIAMLAGFGEPLMSPRAKQFRELMRRQVHVLMLWDDREPHLEQLHSELGAYAPLLKRRRRFKEQRFPTTDHTFTPVVSQREVNAAVLDHMTRLAQAEETPPV